MRNRRPHFWRYAGDEGRLKSYVAVETKEKAIALEKYFKSGSGKAIAIF